MTATPAVLGTRLIAAAQSIDHRLAPGSWRSVLIGLIGCVEWGPFSRPTRWEDLEADGVTVASIAWKAGISKRQTQRLLPTLEELGLLVRRRLGDEGRASHYRLIPERILELGASGRATVAALVSTARAKRRQERAEYAQQRAERAQQAAAALSPEELAKDPLFCAVVEVLAEHGLEQAPQTVAGRIRGSHGLARRRRVIGKVRTRRVAELLPLALEPAQELAEQRQAELLALAEEAAASELRRLAERQAEQRAEQAAAAAQQAEAEALAARLAAEAEGELPELRAQAEQLAAAQRARLEGLEDLPPYPRNARPFDDHRKAVRRERERMRTEAEAVRRWLARLEGAGDGDPAAQLATLRELLAEAPPQR